MLIKMLAMMLTKMMLTKMLTKMMMLSCKWSSWKKGPSGAK